MSIAALKINLDAGTAVFESGLDSAANKAGSTADKIKNSFDKVNFHEAQGGLMLLEDSLGVRLPRHLNSLISKLPGVGAAMSAALPIAGFVVAGEKALELAEHFESLRQKEEEMRAKALEIASAWQESGQKIRQEIDAQESKMMSLSQGAVAGFEYAFEHASSVAITRLKDIQSELKETGKAIADNTSKFLMFGLDKPNADLDVFSANLHKVMLDAEDGSNGDKFKALSAGIDLATGKAAELQTKMDGMKQPSAMAGGMAMASWQEQIRLTKQEADSVDEVIKNLLLLSNLQASTNAVHNSGDATLRIEEATKAYQAEKTITDARTKENIAASELEFAQGKITALQLSDLKQAALDAQYTAAVAHFERLKVLDAGRPELLKQTQAEETALTFQHDAELFSSSASTFNKQKQLLNELDNLNTEFFNKDQARETEAANKAIALAAQKNKVLLADAALIQGEGNKKIAGIDAEIRNLNRLIEQYHLTGTAAQSLYNSIHALSTQRQKDIADELLKSTKLSDNFHGAMLKMAVDGQQWHTKLADGFGQSISQMNQSLVAFVTTGKGNFASLAQGAIGNFIEMGLKYGESKLMMEMIDKLFGAKKGIQNVGMAQSNTAVAATEALASVPWPFNIAAAAETEGVGQAFSAQAGVVAFFERGGEVPDGAATGIPAVLHPKEMVLDRALADVVRGAAANKTSGDQSNGNARNATYAPTIHAGMASAKDIDTMLKGHFDRWARSEARKRYSGA
jgi:hypothetical protein